MACLRPRAWLLVVLFPLLAGAEIKIAAKDRMRNRPPGRCGWCALETLARHQRIKILYGLTDRNATRCSPEDLEDALTDAGVRYRIQYPGKRDTAILYEAIRKGRGAAIGFRERRPGLGGHIVTLVDFGLLEAKVIDSSDPFRRVRTLPRKTFMARWDGLAVVLEDDREAKTVWADAE